MATNETETARGDVCGKTSLLDDFSVLYGEVHGYVGFATCVVGSVANLIIVSVLIHQHMRTSTNTLLLWIAVADFLMMVVCAPTYLHFYIYRHTQVERFCTMDLRWIHYFIFYCSFTIVCHTAGIWLTVVLALFRLLYLTVKTAVPVKSNKTATLVAATIYLFSIILTVPNILVNGWSASVAVHTSNYSHVVYCISTSQFAANNGHVTVVNFWISGLFMRLAPTLLMIVLTVLLLHQLRSASTRRSTVLRRASRTSKDDAHRKQESRTTAMLIGVVLTFLVIELPQGALSLLNHLDDCFYVGIYQKLGDLIDGLTLIKNLINFVLLTTMSKQFRTTFVSQTCSVILFPYKCTLRLARRNPRKDPSVLTCTEQYDPADERFSIL